MCANWRGSKLTLTAQTLIWCLSMGKQHMLSNITTHFIFSLDFFCNHICLLQQHHTTQKYAIWWSGWSAVKILWWKVGSTPRKIRHVRPKLLCSSLGANKNSEQGLPLGAKLKHSNLGRTCSIHIYNTPFFWLSQPSLEKERRYCKQGVQNLVLFRLHREKHRLLPRNKMNYTTTLPWHEQNWLPQRQRIVGCD